MIALQILTAIGLFVLIASMVADGGLRTPRSRASGVAIVALAYIGAFLASYIAVRQEFGAVGDELPEVDNLRVAYTGLIGGFAVFSPLALLLAAPFLRRVELPQKLFASRSNRPVLASILTVLYVAIAVALMLMAALAASEASLLAAPLTALAYIALCGPAAWLAPRSVLPG